MEMNLLFWLTPWCKSNLCTSTGCMPHTWFSKSQIILRWLGEWFVTLLCDVSWRDWGYIIDIVKNHNACLKSIAQWNLLQYFQWLFPLNAWTSKSHSKIKSLIFLKDSHTLIVLYKNLHLQIFTAWCDSKVVWTWESKKLIWAGK